MLGYNLIPKSININIFIAVINNTKTPMQGQLPLYAFMACFNINPDCIVECCDGRLLVTCSNKYLLW
jgi:hypothetical protein